jgi:hypothetical protein
MQRSLFHHGRWWRTQGRADNTLSLYEPHSSDGKQSNNI